jgi:hypothetical protein
MQARRQVISADSGLGALTARRPFALRFDPIPPIQPLANRFPNHIRQRSVVCLGRSFQTFEQVFIESKRGKWATWSHKRTDGITGSYQMSSRGPSPLPLLEPLAFRLSAGRASTRLCESIRAIVGLLTGRPEKIVRTFGAPQQPVAGFKFRTHRFLYLRCASDAMRRITARVRPVVATLGNAWASNCSKVAASTPAGMKTGTTV